MGERPCSIIHVGFSNTGTTSLQQNFFSRRDDIFYVGYPYNERGGIFTHLRHAEDFKFDEPAIINLCDSQIYQKSKGRPIIISDEMLCDSPQLYYAPYMVPRDIIAARLFRIFSPARIVFTIRNQKDYVASMYSNLKRNSALFARMPMPPFAQWYKGMSSKYRCNFLQNLNYYEIIQVYEILFGRANILVLPLEQLTMDGVEQYLEPLCRFMGIELSPQDIERYMQPRNVRMSVLETLVAELMPDERFSNFYSTLQQRLGSKQLSEILDTGDRSIVSLGSEELADLRQRVEAGNRLLSQHYDLDLQRYGYPLSKELTPEERKLAPSAGRPISSTPTTPLEQLRAVIDSERVAKARLVQNLTKAMTAERSAFLGRIQELEESRDGERAAYAVRITELENVLIAERAAFGIRMNELESVLSAERAVFATRIGELEDVLGTERTAFGARINELENVLSAERTAFGARIDELESVLSAERAAFGARINELENILSAERAAFGTRINDLEIASRPNASRTKPRPRNCPGA